MFNLLPPIFAKQSLHEQRIRAIVVAAYAIAFGSIIGMSALAPSGISAMFMLRGMSVERAEAPTTIPNEDPQMIIRTITNDAAVLEILGSGVLVSEIMNTVLESKTNTISIMHFHFSLTSAQSGKLSMSGFAETRFDLAAFYRKVQTLPYFSNVISPISNLARNKDIPFSLSVNIQKIAPPPL